MRIRKVVGCFILIGMIAGFSSACDSDGDAGEMDETDTGSDIPDSQSETEDTGEDTGTENNATDSATDAFQFRPMQFAPSTITEQISVSSAYEMGTNGFVTIENRQIRNDYTDSTAHAQFFVVNAEPEDFRDVEFIVQANGLDECSLGVWQTEGTGSDSTPIDWLNAGSVSLQNDEATYDMDWDYINRESEWVRYFVSEFPAAVSGNLTGVLDVIATGDETPEISAGQVQATMPDAIQLNYPENDHEVQFGPLPVEWSEGDASNTVDIRMIVFEKFNESEAGFELRDVHEVRCTVSDDGQFEIPATIMDQLPSGYSAELEIVRKNVAYHPVTDEFKVKTTTSQLTRVDMHIPTIVVDPEGTL